MECGSQQRLPPPPWKTPQSAPLALSLETPCFCWRLPSDKAAVNSCECVRVCARGRAGEGGERERGRRVQREGPTEENERDCRGRERESSRRLRAPLVPRSLVSECSPPPYSPGGLWHWSLSSFAPPGSELREQTQ